MFRLGTLRRPSEPETPEDEEALHLKMIQMLEEHGWMFSYGRDPVLILIEYEEHDEATDTEDL